MIRFSRKLSDCQIIYGKGFCNTVGFCHTPLTASVNQPLKKYRASAIRYEIGIKTESQFDFCTCSLLLSLLIQKVIAIVSVKRDCLQL